MKNILFSLFLVVIFTSCQEKTTYIPMTVWDKGSYQIIKVEKTKDYPEIYSVVLKTSIASVPETSNEILPDSEDNFILDYSLIKEEHSSLYNRVMELRSKKLSKEERYRLVYLLADETDKLNSLAFNLKQEIEKQFMEEGR